MNTNKIMYWLALGVFGLGLRSEYRNGGFPAIHRMAEHAGSALCRIATRAEQTAALARVLTSDQPSAVNDLLASVRDAETEQVDVLRDQAQADLLRDRVRAQADLMRAQAELQRSQIEQIRWRTQPQLRFAKAAQRRVTLICPKTGARISVDAGPSVVEVGDTF
jgi:ribosome-binding factor A